MIELSLEAARALMLAAQGLLRPPAAAATKADVLDTIRRMGVLQIDTIHVVARSPYLVLWSRLGDYDPAWLDELLAEGALFEYWAHEACFLPIEEYPLYRRLMLNGHGAPWLQRTHDWLAEHREAADALLAHIREQGPVRSADFKRTDGQKSGWWNWKFEKHALEMLFYAGDLMIARRHNFQRIYDLRERVLPGWDDGRALPADGIPRLHTLKALRALGVAQARWLPDYFRTPKSGAAALAKSLLDEGAIVEARVEGWRDPAYLHADLAALAGQAAAGTLQPERTTLLSPFDPLVWDRARAKAMFDFAYTIECYTPAPKRRYGYFTLPILHRGALIGRLDPKAHRKEGLFEVKALHLEPDVAVDDELVACLAGALRDVAAWHRTPEVVVRQSDPPHVGPHLTEALATGRDLRQTSERSLG